MPQIATKGHGSLLTGNAGLLSGKRGADTLANTNTTAVVVRIEYFVSLVDVIRPGTRTLTGVSWQRLFVCMFTCMLTCKLDFDFEARRGSQSFSYTDTEDVSKSA